MSNIEQARALLAAAAAGGTLPDYKWFHGSGNCPAMPAGPERDHQEDYERQIKSIHKQLLQGSRLSPGGETREGRAQRREQIRAALEKGANYDQDITRLPGWPEFVALSRILKGL